LKVFCVSRKPSSMFLRMTGRSSMQYQHLSTEVIWQASHRRRSCARGHRAARWASGQSRAAVLAVLALVARFPAVRSRFDSAGQAGAHTARPAPPGSSSDAEAEAAVPRRPCSLDPTCLLLSARRRYHGLQVYCTQQRVESWLDLSATRHQHGLDNLRVDARESLNQGILSLLLR
jgi:hypothetical protein